MYVRNIQKQQQSNNKAKDKRHTNFSRVGNQDTLKWQLAKNNQ